MNNQLNIVSYNPFDVLGIESYQYVLHYNILSASKEIVIKHTSKWVNKDSVLQDIKLGLLNPKSHFLKSISEIQINLVEEQTIGADKSDYIENVASAEKIKFSTDLRGIKFYDSIINFSFHNIHYSRMDYCLFDKVKFIGKDSTNHHGFQGFFGNSFNHARFNNCDFTNINFRSGEHKNIVFYCCNFDTVTFNSNSDGVYKNIIFLNCKFNDVDFAKTDVRSFCFFGRCEFSNIKINKRYNYNSIIGVNIRRFVRNKDIKTWKFRRSVKSTTYSGNKSWFNFYQKSEKKAKVNRLLYTSLVYEGLFPFYQIFR